MTFRQTEGPAIAAAKVPISTASAYRYEQHHSFHHPRGSHVVADAQTMSL